MTSPEAEALQATLAAADRVGPRVLDGLVARLAERGLLRSVEAPPGVDPATAAIRGLAYDSRRVIPGGLFVAVPGAHVDGHAFVGAAITRGAAAVIVERPVAAPSPLVQLVVERSQSALAVAAAWWFGDPGRELGVVGITGTDGKTTTAGMVVAVLEAAGIRTGLVSTAEQKIGAVRAGTPSHVTTPEAPELQRALRAMVLAGDGAAVVETTSHGLALERVGEIPYDVAIFTNLSHEHLELHGTFEAYRAAKRSLFERLGRAGGSGTGSPAGVPGGAAAGTTRAAGDARAAGDPRAAGAVTGPGSSEAAGPGPRAAAKAVLLPGGRPWPAGGIVNLDDAEASTFAEATRAAGATLFTYGTVPADVRAEAVDETAAGLRLSVATPRGPLEVVLPLVGRFNAHNALAAVALGELLGLDHAAVVAGLEGFRGIPGRMQRIDRGQPFTVIVDYAHTPASLAVALEVLAPLTRGSGGLIAVFGSAGERDVTKRAIQGRVAGERCRLVIATDEDPRGEDPVAILESIAAGAEDAGRRRGDDLLLVPDREEAIRTAFALARPGDVVLLAGKGHEQSILYADHELVWDERAVAERVLEELGY